MNSLCNIKVPSVPSLNQSIALASLRKYKYIFNRASFVSAAAVMGKTLSEETLATMAVLDSCHYDRCNAQVMEWIINVGVAILAEDSKLKIV